MYKQINAPFGDLAKSTLTVSTFALESNSPGDVTYTNLENRIASWTTRRDALAAQIKTMLDAAEFQGQPVNHLQAFQIIVKSAFLLGEATSCANDPAACSN